MRVPDAQGDLPANGRSVKLTREQFGELTRPILTRIELPIRRALGDARLNRTDIDEVILVGGATRMPAVVSRVAEIFDRAPHCRLNPDEVVALGAAVQAALFDRSSSVEDMVVTDVSPFTLGVAISKKLANEHRDGYFLPLIHRNTTIPISRVERVTTVVPISRKSWSKSIKAKTGGPTATATGRIQSHGHSARTRGAGCRHSLHLRSERRAGGRSHGRRDWQSRQSRDFAPRAQDERRRNRQGDRSDEAAQDPSREDAANRLTLRRAERWYQELPMIERQMLGELLDGFEAALELGDKTLIERHREQVSQFLDQFEPESPEGECEAPPDDR